LTPGRAVVLALSLTLALAGCSGGETTAPTTSTEPATFDEQVCQAVSGYLQDLSAEVNRFQAESREAADPAERRRLYLDAWDRVARVNDELESAIDALDPDAEPYATMVVDALTAALAANRAEAADGVEEAMALRDDAYDRITVPDGSLFTGAEKMRSKVRFALGEVAAITCAS
jgi:hypothetical protein